jgi:hypothetical protein
MREMDLDKTKWNNWISGFIDSYKEVLEKEGKVNMKDTVRMKESELVALDIHEKFLEDQIRIWVGLLDGTQGI